MPRWLDLPCSRTRHCRANGPSPAGPPTRATRSITRSSRSNGPRSARRRIRARRRRSSRSPRPRSASSAACSPASTTRSSTAHRHPANGHCVRRSRTRSGSSARTGRARSTRADGVPTSRSRCLTFGGRSPIGPIRRATRSRSWPASPGTVPRPMRRSRSSRRTPSSARRSGVDTRPTSVIVCTASPRTSPSTRSNARRRSWRWARPAATRGGSPGGSATCAGCTSGGRARRSSPSWTRRSVRRPMP